MIEQFRDLYFQRFLLLNKWLTIEVVELTISKTIVLSRSIGIGLRLSHNGGNSESYDDLLKEGDVIRQ